MTNYSKTFCGDDIIGLFTLVNNCIYDNDDLKVKRIDIQENGNNDTVYRYDVTVIFCGGNE